MNREFRKYLLYAIGDDIRRLQQLKSVRAETILESFSTFMATSVPDDGNTEWYDAALTASADTELESMLYDYYRTVDRIASIERDMNNVVRELTLRFQTETAKDLPQIVFREPLLMYQQEQPNSPEELEAIRQRYWELLTDSVTHSLFRSAINQSVMQEYEHLLSLGRQLVNRINDELGDATAIRAAADIYSTDSSIGHPILIEAGRPGYHSYGVFAAPSPSHGLEHVYNSIWIEDDALNARYTGGQPWAYLYIKYGPIDILVERFSNDYSVYDRIRLELKRENNTECSELRLEIKDIDDAVKGDLRSVPLALTPKWQTYTVELAEFVEADLTRLNVVAGFLFGGPQPCSISIRDVRYLKPE